MDHSTDARPDGEVRCRRLVVVDDDGFERVVLEALPMAASIDLYGKPRGREEPLKLALVVSEETIEGYAGLYLVEGDDEVQTFTIDGTPDPIELLESKIRMLNADERALVASEIDELLSKR